MISKLIKFKLILLISLILSFSGINSSQYQNNQSIQVHENCGPATVVFVGASNTAYVPYGGWVKKLANIGSPWTNHTIVNSGLPGWGIYSYYKDDSRIDILITSHNPDYLLINLGGNDFLRNPDINATTYKMQYKWVIDNILNKEGGKNITKVYMMNMIWTPKFFEFLQYQLDNYFEMQTAVSELVTEYNFTLIDVYSVTLNHSEYFKSDNIHMLDNGYIAVAQKVHDIMSPMIITNEANTPTCPPSSSNISEATTSINTKTANISDTNETPVNYYDTFFAIFLGLITIKIQTRRGFEFH